MTLQEQMQLSEAPKQEAQPIKLKDQMENSFADEDPREGLKLAETFVKKFYLDELDRFKITNPSRSVRELSTDRNIKMFKISGLVFDKDENVLDRLNNVYSSMHGLNLSVLFMIISDGIKVDLYMGTKTITEDFMSNLELGKAFEKSFKGNFPGSNIIDVDITECNSVLENVIPKDGSNAVTSLTSLPSLKNDDAENNQFVQGIEKFIDTMQGETYSVLIISDPISGGQIEQVKQGYEELYSQLSPLSEYSLTVGENKGVSMSESEMTGYTDTIGKSVSKTQSFTKGTSTTKSKSTTNTLGVSAGIFGSTGVSNAVTDSVTKGGNAMSPLGITLYGGKAIASAVVSGVTQAMGINLGLNASKAKQHGTSEGTQESTQIGSQETEQSSKSTSQQTTLQKGANVGSSTSSMIKYENKSIRVFLECIDDHLKRLKDCENYGMWSSAAYFISPSRETSIISASAYKGIINGEGSSLESTSMNTWFKDEATKKVNEYLRHFTHPRFHDPDFLINFKAVPDVTPATMLSTKELSIQCGIPYNSIPGLFVREMASFGRNIYESPTNDSYLRVGNIYHMGREYQNHPVLFNLDRLREHTFITGSTGSGKSNTVYSIISRLNQMIPNDPERDEYTNSKIPTLIIEPAKGEYKQVFGDRFNVYGTNPAITNILRINPFKFEKDIHVLEHIDRLVDIFNVCWPMYAAMPAVLKEAIEKAYISCGWDLDNSQNKNEIEIYPNFIDLLSSLREVISSSDYSQEVKDNYTGSLITRVKSLTNGLNGQIFSADEIDNNKLFNESTIVDLSRVGSNETKSMIMGILIMRLQERRMCEGGINLPLKHVTVIEEAHNLLKRTSTEQSSEGANLLGKSVEMIANAIAEMRTYGEGFIIVDQAPALLDMSVIRNTNTKIIMHLPDFTDRELVGKSAGLSDDQIIELAKIPTGVAAVYQNKWVEPVLCKIDECKVKPKEYRNPDNGKRKSVYAKERIVKYLLSNLNGVDLKTDIEEVNKWLMGSDISSSVKIDLMRRLRSGKDLSRTRIEKLVTAIVDNENKAFEKSKDTDDIEEWNRQLLDHLDIPIDTFDSDDQMNILECLIHQRSLERASDEENFLKWMQFMGRKVI